MGRPTSPGHPAHLVCAVPLSSFPTGWQIKDTQDCRRKESARHSEELRARQTSFPGFRHRCLRGSPGCAPRMAPPASHRNIHEPAEAHAHIPHNTHAYTQRNTATQPNPPQTRGWSIPPGTLASLQDTLLAVKVDSPGRCQNTEITSFHTGRQTCNFGAAFSSRIWDPMPDLILPRKGGRDFASLSGLSLAQACPKAGGGISSGDCSGEERPTERVSIVPKLHSNYGCPLRHGRHSSCSYFPLFQLPPPPDYFTEHLAQHPELGKY